MKNWKLVFKERNEGMLTVGIIVDPQAVRAV